MTENRIIAMNDNTGDVFLDLTADAADRRHYLSAGYRLRTVGRFTSDNAARDLARFIQANMRLGV